jgi:hypothetical protein
MRSPAKNYSNHQNCAHAWAHQLSPNGHASNLYFEGPTIFSYGSHFPIATLDENRVFFTTEGYSVSTSKHKCRVHSAVSHLKIVYVKHVPLGTDPASDESFIRKNIEDWISEIQHFIITLDKYPRRLSLLKEIDYLISLLRTFIGELGISPDDNLQQVLDHPSLNAIAELNAARKLKAAKAEQKRLALLSKLFTGLLTAWRTDLNCNGSLHNPIDSNLAYLRWNDHIQCVETSKGIQVPLEVAKKCYDFLHSVLPEGCSDCDFSLMGFQINSVSPEYLNVGCHKIAMNEVTDIARELEWIDPGA